MYQNLNILIETHPKKLAKAYNTKPNINYEIVFNDQIKTQSVFIKTIKT